MRNTTLLKQLYCVHAPSGKEHKMKLLVTDFAVRCGAHVEEDKSGNLLITKGCADTYPCVAAHLDQVQSKYADDYKLCQMNGIIFGWSDFEMAQQGLGADDKNGIYIALYCLQKYDAIKVAFFVEEEIGCRGSGAVDLVWFVDCRFVIEPDRMGGNDLITSMSVGDVCSKDFIKAISKGAKKFRYKEEVGSITDVGELVERGVGISCLNLSCGYYHPHTQHEVCVLAELDNCLRFVCWIIDNCTDVYPHEYEFKWYSKSWFGYNGYSNYYGESYYYDDYEHDFDKMSDYIDLLDGVKPSFEEVVAHCDLRTKKKKKLQEIYDEVLYYKGMY